MNKEKYDKAVAYFKQGYNCSQSVVASWCEEVGLDLDTALKISCGFGGGMGRLREVCGACTGAFMILGMKYGEINGVDGKAKPKNYEVIQAFAKRFKEENGKDTIVCRELLGLPGASKPMPAERTEEYYRKRPCGEIIGIASSLLDEFMNV